MPTWIEAYNLSRSSMAKTNGTTPAGLPRVTNEQAASILRTSVALAEKHKFPAAITERWYELALALAGWRQPGDRFLVTAEHRQAMFPDSATPLLWQTALNVAQLAQTKGIAFTAPTVNPPTDYQAVLKQAWAKMQREAKATNQPAPSSPMPVSLPEATSTPTPEGSGMNPLLILGALYLMSRRKGR